jgi:hypothetical protein
VVDAMDASPIGLPDVSLNVSVGVAEFPRDGETERILVPHVEAMVHESIRLGGNAVTVFRG